MTERALKCPQCNGPLDASRFARTVVCPFCGDDGRAGRGRRLRHALQGGLSRVELAGRERPCDVVLHRREPLGAGSLPRPRGDLRRLRGPARTLAHGARDREGPAKRGGSSGLRPRMGRLDKLQESASPEAAGLLARLPAPVIHGEAGAGAFAGSRVSVRRWAAGFTHTLEAFQRAFPRGIDPQPSIWIWRRILEVLAFLHREGLAHGAVLPCHLLAQDGEHGLRVVGLGCADAPGAALRAVVERFEAHYPRSCPGLSAAHSDGGRGHERALRGRAARRRSRHRRRAGGGAPAVGRAGARGGDGWHEPGTTPHGQIRERLGHLAQEVFGSPKFCPLVMPR